MRIARPECLAVLLVALCLTESGPVQAASLDNTLDDASPQQVVDGMSNKLVRGVTNIATGWLEIPKQIYLTWKEEGAAKGLTVGPVKGIGMTLVRTGSGVGETLTFPVAYPGFYDPFFHPSFVWQKE